MAVVAGVPVKPKFIVEAGVSEFPVRVNGEVTSVIVTLLSDEATTFNPDMVLPAAKVPKEPALVVKDGPVDACTVCEVSTAFPSGFSM